VSLLAPVIGAIARAVLHHSNAQIAEPERSPRGCS
jgi:hypothetical protein